MQTHDTDEAGRRQMAAASPRADTEVARMIRLRLPSWVETVRAEHVHRFTDPDPAADGRYIEVDGRDQLVITVDELAADRMGPTVIGYARGMCVRTVLPHMSARSDRLGAIEAAAAIGAVPRSQEPQDVYRR